VSMVRNQGRVTRFVVMAVLQAARAQTLGLPHDSALSWGLNRAIFYAAAKRGFKSTPPSADSTPTSPAVTSSTEVYRLGDEEAHRDPTAPQLTFTIGGDDQTVTAFEKQVTSRFGTKENFRTAWEEALRLVGGFDRGALESRRRFYDDVYRPLRDELSDRWTQEYSPLPKKTRP
jgi:hypothetical protein